MTGIEACHDLIHAANRLARQGLFRATSGNLSLRLQSHPLTLALTRSGSDKAQLQADDIIGWCDQQVLWGEGRPSAETGVHQAIYQKTDAGAVLHVHSVANNAICARIQTSFLCLSDNEMIKALGFWDERAELRLPLIENHTDLIRLADAAKRAVVPEVPGLLIRNHGLYAFGQTLADAIRHLEAFEFLFEWQLQVRSISPPSPR